MVYYFNLFDILESIEDLAKSGWVAKELCV